MNTEQLIQDNSGQEGEASRSPSTIGETAIKDQKMAANPNPRANENINQTPIEKTTEDADSSAGGVGSEITDGEGG